MAGCVRHPPPLGPTRPGSVYPLPEVHMRHFVETFVGTVVFGVLGVIFLYALLAEDPIRVEVGRRAAAERRVTP